MRELIPQWDEPVAEMKEETSKEEPDSEAENIDMNRIRRQHRA